MRITNRLNLPKAIIEACRIERHNAPGCLSATTLLKGIKQIILEERHWDELEDDVANRIWALFGTTTHKLLEDESPDEFTEVDVKTELDGMTITGRIDCYNMQTGIISDWKTASIWKVIHDDYTDWEAQGKIYAYLLKKSGFVVNKCQFVALLKDHSKSKARYDRSYPQSPVSVYKFDIKQEHIDNAEEFIKRTIACYKAARVESDDIIPPCSPYERWEREPQFAVMKHGRKSAVRVFETKIEAQVHIERLYPNNDMYYLEERKSVSRRCRDYCLVNKFCNFYKENVEKEEGK